MAAPASCKLCKLSSGRVFLATAAVHYASAVVSDRGRKRASNEDAFGLSAEHGVYLVCDGMGGAAAGEVASSLAVEEVLRQLSRRAKPEAASLENAIEEAVAAANQAIYSCALSNPRLRGMGTTLVGLVAEARRVLVFNVGDSRCYRLRSLQPDPSNSGPSSPEQNRPEPILSQNLPEPARPVQSRLEQISLDHSLVAEQVRMGRMTQAEARNSPLHNVITRALGTESTVEPDLFELEAAPGDLFLLCSDGLTNELADSLIASILAADLPLDELCALLVDAANRAGGRDNITCLLVRAEG
jgi:serine/threonine protein phosphatase PrpC